MTDWLETPGGWQGNKVFQKDIGDGHLCVIVGMEPTEDGPQWHMSISHRSNHLANMMGGALPGRIPTWDEIKEARYRFVPDEFNMAMMLPPKKMYVNLHPTAMHLWQVDMKYAGK